ncbi:MAG TPA: TonB-dependent receptor, partial [Usitatibacter sp.]|nr:TonB-dependent receptor [Usitatibacter sp.]
VGSALTLRAYYTYSDSSLSQPQGGKIPYIPRDQVNLGAVISPGWHSLLSVYAVYRSERFVDEANTPGLALPAGWDAQVDFYVESADKHWSLEAYATNLLKKPHVSDVLGMIVSYRF